MTGIRAFFLISLIFYSINPGICQEEEPLSLKERRALAVSNITELHEGVLIVRLQSQQKKMQALQELIDGGELDDKTEKKMREQLVRTKAKTAHFNRAIIKAFEQKYRFSNILFMLDTASISLKNGARAGIFLNQDLEIDPMLTLDDQPYFILRFGYTRSNSGQNIEAMIVMDDEFNDLESPFPFYVRTNNFDAIMGGLFPKPKQEQKNANRMVEKLQQKLIGFLENFK